MKTTGRPWIGLLLYGKEYKGYRAKWIRLLRYSKVLYSKEYEDDRLKWIWTENVLGYC